MTTNDNEIIDSQTDTEETENPSTEQEEEIVLEEVEDEEETITIPKKKWTEALAQREHLQKKVEKVITKPIETTPQSSDLSSKDLIALMNAKVHEEDVDEVLDFAKYKKIPVSEALKSPVLKSVLNDKAEKRNTANATHVGTSKRTTQTISDESLIANAKAGKLPETEEGIIRLWRARKGLK